MWRYNYTKSYELYHHGVKGQKWGVRNGPPYPLKKDLTNAPNKDTIVKDAISSGEVLVKINREKQLRHIKNSKEYQAGRSYIDGNLDTAQKLVDELSGTGEPIVVKGKWQYKEQVESAHVVGTYVSESGEETKSNKATIVYSKTGSHVYPRKEIPNES